MKDKEINNSGGNSGIDINTDENLSGTTHLNEPLTEGSEQDKIKAELEEMKDKYLRKVAEFDNFRRRTAKERIELIQTAGRDVITDLLEAGLSIMQTAKLAGTSSLMIEKHYSKVLADRQETYLDRIAI